ILGTAVVFSGSSGQDGPIRHAIDTSLVVVCTHSVSGGTCSRIIHRFSSPRQYSVGPPVYLNVWGVVFCVGHDPWLASYRRWYRFTGQRIDQGDYRLWWRILH